MHKGQITRLEYGDDVLNKAQAIPSPIGRGFKLEMNVAEELMVVDWMDSQPAPEAILALLAYKCSKTCTLPHCFCGNCPSNDKESTDDVENMDDYEDNKFN